MESPAVSFTGVSTSRRAPRAGEQPPAWWRGLRAVVAGIGVLALAACAAQTGPKEPLARATPSTQSASTTPTAPTRGPVPVALLVPLGAADDRAATSAVAIRNAAELALSGPAGTGLRIATYDTLGTPEGATNAANRALADGARLILGPLFAANARAVGAVAGPSGVSVLSFSTDTEVAGGPVFVTGFAPEIEVARILEYASRQGIRTIGVYAPNVPYGLAALRGVEEAAGRSGVSVVAEEIYPRSFQDIERTAPDFVARAQAAGAEAILLPDFGQGLAIAASFVNFHGMPQPDVRYLGIGQWEAGETLRAPELAGGWFAGADTIAVDTFAQRYATRYGSRPPFVAVLGYDAARIAAMLVAEARTVNSIAPFTRPALTRPGGFEGAIGNVRLRPDGTADRGLAILEVGPGRFVLREPAADRPAPADS
ncbi:MAG: penicillin-binding protein activator [Pseudomonadota bacterium]